MRITLAALDAAAEQLRRSLPVFTRGNLYHVTGRTMSRPLTTPAFEAALERRLARGPIDGLLPRRACARGVSLSRSEEAAYFPAGILLVDRASLVDLFAASGVLVQARIAVVDVTGYPRHVVSWLVRGARRGHRAPVGFLHDAATTLYPFLFEPLATMCGAEAPLAFRDLGIGAAGTLRDNITRRRERELEAITPAALLAYATRAMLAMIPGDDLLLPLRKTSR